jgi:hypothetical protein
LSDLLRINISLRKQQADFLRQMTSGVEADLSFSEALAVIIDQARAARPLTRLSAGKTVLKHLTISADRLAFLDYEAKVHGLTRSDTARRLIDAAMSG